MKVPTYIQSIKPYIPGKPIEEVEREIGISGIVKLASNENPIGPSPKALKAISDAMQDINRYPDGGGYYLRQKISEKFQWPIEGIILGSGSVEIIEILCRAFLQDQTDLVVSSGAFIMYKLAAQQVNAHTIEVPMNHYRHDLRAMADAVTDDTPLVFIANPNNPTGTYNTIEEMKDFLSRVPRDTIVVVDEAYFEYMTAEDYPDGLDFLKEGHNLIALRTFSKIYGLAGLRIGYGFGRPEIFDILNRIRSPFNTSSLAQAGAMGALDDDEFAHEVREMNSREMNFLESELKALRVPYIPSVTNFILVDMERDGREIYQQLLYRGVIVRPVAGYGFKSHLRVSIGTHEENVAFVHALKELLEK